MLKLIRTPIFKSVVATASFGGVSLWHSDGEHKHVWYGVNRLGNLVYCVSKIAVNYGYHMNFNKGSINEKKIQELTNELDELINKQRLITIKHNDNQYSDWDQYMDEIGVVKEAMNSLTDELLSLKKHQLNRIHVESATLLRDLCMKNKGVYIKLGQHLCQLDYILPREYCHILRDLLDKNPVSSYEQVCDVIKQELGESPEVLFRSFDRTPLASASLAQVHTAIGHDGVKYAVKIQHHHLKDDAKGDLVAINAAVNCIAKIFEGFKYDWLLREMNRNLPLELDFL